MGSEPAQPVWPILGVGMLELLAALAVMSWLVSVEGVEAVRYLVLVVLVTVSYGLVKACMARPPVALGSSALSLGLGAAATRVATDLQWWPFIVLALAAAGVLLIAPARWLASLSRAGR